MSGAEITPPTVEELREIAEGLAGSISFRDQAKVLAFNQTSASQREIARLLQELSETRVKLARRDDELKATMDTVQSLAHKLLISRRETKAVLDDLQAMATSYVTENMPALVGEVVSRKEAFHRFLELWRRLER